MELAIKARCADADEGDDRQSLEQQKWIRWGYFTVGSISSTAKLLTMTAFRGHRPGADVPVLIPCIRKHGFYST